jgi:uncharacterized repeat protein (TIGR03803 family)
MIDKSRGYLLMLSIGIGLVVLESHWALAQTFTVLHNFAGPPDGGLPYAALVDANGVLYGTTLVGGAGACTMNYEPVGCGIVFKVIGKKETVLYSFKGEPDGLFPTGGLVRDKSGKLYGTTPEGGAYGYGTVFKIAGTKETVLYSFKGVPDGAYPSGTLVQDAAGNFYGVTGNGGANGGGGTVFKVDAKGNETVLYSFCSKNQSGICVDGQFPVDNGGLIMDASGNLYGTTTSGGIPPTGYGDAGTVFKLDMSGNETVLYSFCSEVNCADGANPEGGLVMDAEGNLYGTTEFGGSASDGPGVAFKLYTSGQQTVLHTFCSEEECADGGGPVAGLIMDAKGSLYGTSDSTVFELDASGSFSVLHTFTGIPGPVEPVGGLVMDAKGNLYGTTSQGGTGNCNPLEFYGCGVVFKIKP